MAYASDHAEKYYDCHARQRFLAQDDFKDFEASGDFYPGISAFTQKVNSASEQAVYFLHSFIKIL